MYYGKSFFRGFFFDTSILINTLVSFSDKARREGLLALEDDVNKLLHSFLQKGIQLVVDGTDPELVRSILETEMNNRMQALEYDWRVWKEFLIFLASENPQTEEIFEYLETILYPSGNVRDIIIEFLSKFSNEYKNFRISKSWDEDILSHPLLGRNVRALAFYKYDRFTEMLDNQFYFYRNLIQKSFMIMTEGSLSIQSGDNPRIVKEKLTSFLDPSERAIKEQDEAGGE